ncbi:MAG: tRNA (adenosine(37)-N6)-threonylcarbamoyltransferase complex dimerization subunit type 1 TsaB [Sphingobacteriaceae bacterium]|nr:tRNA (adenosine(37)-N6)-threonylcarbamoyltransferase complex dimerization subunit type 1 TsaB [Sphingobacteriaceae bacterium]
MALILQLETSTSSCSVALALDGQVLALKELNERNAHAGMLTLLIEEAMTESGKAFSELNAVAVSMGPGSYTGLRIGVSTAKGLCYALDVPLIAVNTLEAMTFGMKSAYEDDSVFYCPMIDARRMEVYSAVYNPNMEEVLPVDARIIDENSFSELLKKKKVLFFGDGAMKCKDALSYDNALFISDFINSAAHLTALAYQKFKENNFVDVAYFEPFYLKDFLVTQPKAVR